MDISQLRAKIAEAQARLADLSAQLDELPEAEVEALAVEFLPLLNRLNHLPGQVRLPGQARSPLFEIACDQYRALLDAVSAGILIYDEQQVIRFVNKKAIQYIGYDPTGETRDHYLQKIVLADWSGRPLSMDDRPANLVWDGIRADEVQMMITTQAGQVFQVLVTAIPLSQAGQFAGAVVIWNDVTLLERAIVEKKQREEQLRESEARFRVALASSPIYAFSLDRDLRYTWLYAPGQAERAESVLGMRNEEIAPDSDMQALEALKRQVIQTGVGFRKEIHLWLHGEQRVFDMAFEPLRDSTGQISGLTGAAVDITERRNLEARQNEYAARMELHHRMVEQREQDLLHYAETLHDEVLQGMISLIADIQLAGEMVRKDPTREDPVMETMHELEGRAKELADRLRAVCRELNPPAVTRFGLKRAIQAHLQDLQKRYPGIAFKLSLMEDILKLPDALCLALYRIYQEAVQNTLQHAAASSVTVQLSFKTKEVTLEIEDNGAGFVPPSANWMDLIMNGQFGLVSMKEQAEAIHAKFSLTSTPGQGTQIRVTAPIGEK